MPNYEFQKRSCYLAGPITGLTYNNARYGWRSSFSTMLGKIAPHIECYSPMRQKEFLSSLQGMQCRGADLDSLEHAISRPLGILGRDRNDVRERDVIVACFLGAEKASIGTVWEIGYACALQKPIVVIMEEKNNPHDHVFITHTAHYVVPTLEEAAKITASLLTPDI